MLQKFKNRLQLLIQNVKKNLIFLINKWKSIDIISRFISIMLIINTMIIFTSIPNISTFLKEENYMAMEQLVYTIVEQKDTQVDFDTSKIEQYEVTYKEKGIINVYIQGKSLEKIYVTIDEDYQIKKFIKAGLIQVVLLYVFYCITVYCLSYSITVILFFINRTIKKIKMFFQNK